MGQVQGKGMKITVSLPVLYAMDQGWVEGFGFSRS
jgi:hypothetical protein